MFLLVYSLHVQGHVSTDIGLQCEDVCVRVEGNSLGTRKPKEWSQHNPPCQLALLPLGIA